jgi:WD40 repeat protein
MEFLREAGLIVRRAEGRVTLEDALFSAIRDTVDLSASNTAVAFLGSSWAVAGTDGLIVVRNWERRTEVGRVQHPQAPPASMALLASGQLVTVGLDGIVRWWRVTDGALLTSMPTTTGLDRPRVAVSRSGSVLAVDGWGDEIEVFTADGSRRSRFRPGAQTGKANGERLDRFGGVLALSRSGALLAVGVGPTIEIWDTGSGALRRRLTGHEADVTGTKDYGGISYVSAGRISDLTFTRDERRLISAANDGVAKAWDLAAGEVVANFAGHGTIRENRNPIVTRSDVPLFFFFKALTSVALASNEQRILTTSEDGTARTWPFFPSLQALVSHVKSHVTRCLTPEQRRSSRLEPDPPEWCVEKRIWPYDDEQWQRWLRARRAR